MLLFTHLHADEMRPGYLEMKSSDGKSFQVKWKVPMKGDKVLSLTPIMPASCKSTPPSSQKVGSAMLRSWTMHCPDGISGQSIAIKGLENTSTDVLVRLTLEGSTQTHRLMPSQTSLSVEAEQSSIDVMKTYTIIGVEHILLGIDHLLFVFALLLIVNGWRLLIGTITAFTLAHSITLVTATLGWVSVPQAPVEAVIALSILFLAVEVIHAQKGKVGLAERSPWIVAFIFGLLHGFGFAGALAEVGLPEQSIPLALLFFNVGVELGQLIFVFAVVLTGWLIRKVVKERLLYHGETALAYTIGSLAAFWLFERTLSFWV